MKDIRYTVEFFSKDSASWEACSPEFQGYVHAFEELERHSQNDPYVPHRLVETEYVRTTLVLTAFGEMVEKGDVA
jgi:hypothetical protein